MEGAYGWPSGGEEGTYSLACEDHGVQSQIARGLNPTRSYLAE